MNLNSSGDHRLKSLIDALEEAFLALGIDYYLIGALARDFWYDRAKKTYRTTKDADFAILVGSQSQFEAVKQYLRDHKNFQDIKEDSLRMLSPEGVQVDILPFGEFEIDTKIKFDALLEVYRAGTEEVDQTTGNSFKVATLPAIVLLKFIAFDEQPEKRLKDPGDIANIIINFFELQTELIYDNHPDLFENEERTLDEIGAIVIGREMKKICKDNFELLTRIKTIIKRNVDLQENSILVRKITMEKSESQIVKKLFVITSLTTPLIWPLCSGLVIGFIYDYLHAPKA